MDLTIEQIRKMSDEDVAALNRTLAKRVMKKFIILAAVKIGVAVTVSVVAKRMLDRIPED